MKILLDFLYPKYCLSCKTPGSYFCSRCSLKNRLSQSIFIPFNSPIKSVYSLWEYSSPFSDYFKQAKFKPFTSQIFNDLTTHLAKSLSKFNFINHEFSILCPIPLHKKRLKWRGFNQAQIITQILSAHLNLPTYQLIIRSKQTSTQSLLTKAKRQKNLHQAFSPHSQLKTFLKKYPLTRIILVDDLYTTGATTNASAKILKKNGCKNISCLTLARTPHH